MKVYRVIQKNGIVRIIKATKKEIKSKIEAVRIDEIPAPMIPSIKFLIERI